MTAPVDCSDIDLARWLAERLSFAEASLGIRPSSEDFHQRLDVVLREAMRRRCLEPALYRILYIARGLGGKKEGIE